MVWFERAMRLEALALAFVAGLLLWAGLRRRWPSVAAPLGLTVAAALALIGPSTVLEPEWLAVVVTVAGIGLALALPSRPPWGVLSAVLGGLLLMVAAAIKVVTLPIAVIGLVALLLVDRRRCAIATVAAVLGGLVYVGIVALAAPWEFQWMIDSSAMVPDRGNPKVAAKAQVFLGNVADDLADGDCCCQPRWSARSATTWWPARSPACWPGCRPPSRTSTSSTTSPPCPWSAPSACTAPSGGSVRWPPCPSWPCPDGRTTSSPPTPDWRMAYQAQLFTLAAVIAGVTLVLSLGWRIWRTFRPASGGPGPVATLLATLVLLAAWLPASAPNAAESVTLATRDNTPSATARPPRASWPSAGVLRKRIGPDTPVTYLTFGTTNYVLENPSTCEFPTSVFLQRSRTRSGARRARRPGRPTCAA